MAEYQLPRPKVVRIRDGDVTPYEPDSESGVTGVTALQDMKVRGAGLASMISDYLGTFMSMSEHQRTACAVWVLHTHCIDAAYYTPYLNIQSPQRQSGKTTLFDILKLFALNPLDSAHLTAAGLRRAFDEKPVTLFWDEADNIFKKKDEDTGELKAVLNAGFKRGSQVHVMVKKGQQDWSLKPFKVFSAKVICGIGELPDVLASRSIPIKLERKSRQESKKRFEEGREAEYGAFVSQSIANWAKLAVAELKEMDPDSPEFLDGRQSDVWRPLFAIGDLIGWGDRIRDAAVTLHARGTVLSREATLLRDIRDAFSAIDRESMFSQDLADRLNDMETSPWGTYRYGKGIQAHEIAAILDGFGVAPAPIRIGETQRRGYKKDQFIELWERYL